MMLWTHDDDDPLAAARGCLNGLAISALFWLALAIILTR